MRLEIPRSLQPSLKALEDVSFHLKMKFPNIRRNLKFDDGDLDLVLDFCTDPAKNTPWRKVRPQQAKEMKKKLGMQSGRAVDVSSQELDNLLMDSGQSGGAS